VTHHSYCISPILHIHAATYALITALTAVTHDLLDDSAHDSSSSGSSSVFKGRSGLQQQQHGGDEFMAVKPWLGAIREPSQWKETPQQGAAPDADMSLSFVYGYQVLLKHIATHHAAQLAALDVT
jgi:HELP motif